MNIREIVDELLARPSFKQDLIFWLALEAFQDIEGWRRWDTGDIGYSFPKRAEPVDEDEDIEEYPCLVLEQDDYCAWDWVLYGKGTKRIGGKGGYRLAGMAAEAGLSAYHAHLETKTRT